LLVLIFSLVAIAQLNSKLVRPESIEFSHFLLTNEQSMQLLIMDSRIGLVNKLKCYPILIGLIINECSGHIGALRMTINQLNESNYNVSFASHVKKKKPYLLILVGKS